MLTIATQNHPAVEDRDGFLALWVLETFWRKLICEQVVHAVCSVLSHLSLRSFLFLLGLSYV